MGTLAGLIDATHMAAPDLLGNIPWLVFGRLRAMHTNIVIFGFVGSALLGAAQYVVPALLQTPLWSERLGKASLGYGIWPSSPGPLPSPSGIPRAGNMPNGSGRWTLPILLAFALIFYNLLQTAIRRQEKLLYVSIWYIFAALVFTFFIYFFGNAVWNPATGAITGMPDAILAWFYGHGVVGLFLTPLAVGIAYYIIPIVSRSPLLQPYPVPGRLLVDPHDLYPYRHPSPAADAGPHLAEGRWPSPGSIGMLIPGA